jgi:hypothetical protein
MPRSPSQAKGLLLSAILESKDPVIFMEPKILYRAAVEEVPDALYTLPIGDAEVLKTGTDLSIISYGRPLYNCMAAIEAVEKELPGTSIELIDLRTIYPWDRPKIISSVAKTGRAIVVHESMVNYGVGAEVAATIQEQAFLRLKAPVKRLGGWTTHTGLQWEKLILPDIASKLFARCIIEWEVSDTVTTQEYMMPSTKPWITERRDIVLLQFCKSASCKTRLCRYQYRILYCLWLHRNPRPTSRKPPSATFSRCWGTWHGLTSPPAPRRCP